MYKINRFKLSGFRRLYNLDLPMKSNLMVLIGANGVGKTSVLDAFSLLSASAEGKLNASLNEMGGFDANLTYDKADNISFHIEMEIPNYQPLKYDLCLAGKGHSYNIKFEELSQERGGRTPFKHITSRHDDIIYHEVDTSKLQKPTWEHNPLETSLSQVPKMYQQPETLRRILSSATMYHVLDVGKDAKVKQSQMMRPAVLPGNNGEDLIAFLFSLRESDRMRYERIEDTLKAAFPGFEGLNFPPVAAGMLAMTWKDKNYSKPLYANQLSEGTLRFLWLASLLQSPNLPTITMIDEPEVSLHPELLSLLADLMREAAERTQIVVATHSDRLIRFLKPEEVVVMDYGDDGVATAVWADQMDLKKWLEDYSLDEVWRMGRMGGRSL